MKTFLFLFGLLLSFIIQAATYLPISLGSNSGVSGTIDSGLLNRTQVSSNFVYAFSGFNTTTGTPVGVVSIAQDINACTFRYSMAGLANGNYTVALTNDSGATFRSQANVTVSNGFASQNFVPATLLQVGPTRTYTTPSAAAAVATDGVVIEIDAGTYTNDNVIWTNNNLTLRGVGASRPHLNATVQIPNDKGIWVQNANNLIVENIEFSGATVIDSNGAGIRGTTGFNNLTICNSYFHDNQNGFLGGGGNLLIEYSEFANNGIGDGQTHNIYASGPTLFTLQYSYSHLAIGGHLVKTRANENHILYNRLTEEPTGSTSYEIDVPQNGLTYVIGNMIEQGAGSNNSVLFAYGEEAQSNNRQEIYVVNNTFVNDYPNGGIYISVKNGTTGLIENNIFANLASTATVLSGTNTITQTTNLATATPGLVDAANFNYHLAGGSAAINAGTAPGTGAGVNLTPTLQYLHPINQQARPVNGAIDIGAYEF